MPISLCCSFSVEGRLYASHYLDGSLAQTSRWAQLAAHGRDAGNFAVIDSMTGG